jgi:hypothetical protein
MELYPWHSNSLSAGLSCPVDIVQRYVLQPLSELDVQSVFAFGRPWHHVASGAGWQEICRYGENGKHFPGPSVAGWNVVLYRAEPIKVPLVVSWQKGYAGPPGRNRLETLRAILSTPR